MKKIFCIIVFLLFALKGQSQSLEKIKKMIPRDTVISSCGEGRLLQRKGKIISIFLSIDKIFFLNMETGIAWNPYDVLSDDKKYEVMSEIMDVVSDSIVEKQILDAKLEMFEDLRKL